MTVPLEGIYGILPANLEERDLLMRAEAALRGGVRILQYRDKNQEYDLSLHRAKELKALTSCYNAVFIVNDQLKLAVESDADGVHMGRNDMPNLTCLRDDIGAELIVGISCQGDITLAKHAFEYGASYVAIGSIFPTNSKTDVTVIGCERLTEARQALPDKNIVAIGGITNERIIDIHKSGADSAAIISALFEPAEGIEERAAMMVSKWKDME